MDGHVPEYRGPDMTGLDLPRLRELLIHGSSWINNVITYQQVPSTQAMAIMAGNMDAREGTVIIAGQQEAGRGRADHSWFSPPGGLYASIVLRPGADVKDWPVLPLMAGVALARTMRMLGVPAGLKWPNDVNITGRKVAGCLARAVPEKGFVVLGIGVNLRWSKDVILPDNMKNTVTSLYEHSGDKPMIPEESASDMIIGIVNQYRASMDSPDMNLIKINTLLDHENMYKFNELRGIQEEILPDLRLRLRDQTGNTHTLGMDYAAGD